MHYRQRGTSRDEHTERGDSRVYHGIRTLNFGAKSFLPFFYGGIPRSNEISYGESDTVATIAAICLKLRNSRANLKKQIVHVSDIGIRYWIRPQWRDKNLLTTLMYNVIIKGERRGGLHSMAGAQEMWQATLSRLSASCNQFEVPRTLLISAQCVRLEIIGIMRSSHGENTKPYLWE